MGTRAFIILALCALIVGVWGTVALAADIYVGPDPGDDYATIQAAIDAANPTGDTIFVGPGIYNERPVANKSVTITGTGADETHVIIDAGAATSGMYGFSVTADNVTVTNFTLIGDTSMSTLLYGFKPSSVSNFTLVDVTVKEFYRTGVDLLGVTGGVLTNLTSIDNGGHGLSFCDCNGVVVTDFTVSGSGWQGVSVATWGKYSTLGTSGIVFQGANSFVDAFQLEMGDYNNPGVAPAGAAVITYSTNIGDSADVTVQAGDFGYAVHGEQDDSPDQVRIWFTETLAHAALLPAYPGPVGHFTGDGIYIESLTDPTQLYATPGCEIQAAVDAAASSGDVIHIAEGIYTEQIKIDGKSLDLAGPVAGTATVEAVDVGSRTTYSITQWTGSSRSIDACIGVVGPATVNISNLTVDGRELGPDNFYGIHFFDTSGSVTDCRIEDITYPASPGSQKVVSLAASQSAGATAYAIDFSDNVIPNFQKGGILVMGPDITFTVDGNKVTDVTSDSIAGNGIQLSYGATGTTSGNVVQGVEYSGSDWAGSGILLFESGSVSMDGDEVFNCESAVGYEDWGWIYEHSSQVALDFVGLNLHDNAWTLEVQLSRDGSDVDVDITDCIVTDSTGDGIDLWGTGVDPWGGAYYTGWDNGSFVARISGCTVTNTTGYDGIWIDDVSGNATNSMDISVHQTGFSGNNGSALWNGQSDEVDAEYCWWGDPAGPTVIRGGETRLAAPRVSPYGVDLPERGEPCYVDGGTSRAGDGVHGVVDYTPWLTGNIVCVSDPEYLTAADPTKTIAVNYLGGGSDAVFGYSMKFSWDSSIVSTSTSAVNEEDMLSDLGGTFFYAAPGSGDEIVVDCALLGSITGATGPGTLFTIDFTGLAVGTSDIEVTILNVRDQYNMPLSGFYKDDGLLIVDVSVPTITGVEIFNTTLTHTDAYIKDTDGAQVTATVVDDDPLFGAGNITANLLDLAAARTITPATTTP